jgi:outer membrane protein
MRGAALRTATACVLLLIGTTSLCAQSMLADPVPALPAIDDSAARTQAQRLVKTPAACQPTLNPSSATGALEVDLSSAMQSLVCNNPLVRQSVATLTQAQLAVSQAQVQGLPGVRLRAGVDAERGQPTELQTSLRLDWVLFDFGRRDATLVQARQALAAQESEQRARVLAAINAGVARFVAAEAAWARLQAADVSLAIAKDSLRAAAARQQAGAATRADTLQAQTAATQAELEHTQRLERWQLERAALATALGWSPDTALTIAPPTPATLASSHPADPSVLLMEARETHPRIVAARARVRQLQAQVDAEKAARWGSVDAVADVGKTRTPNVITDSASRSTNSVALQWTVPLWDRRETDTRVRDAESRLSAQQWALQDLQNEVALDVWQQAQAVAGSRQALQQSLALRSQADEALTVATQRYRAGVGGFTETLTAQTTAAAARAQAADATARLRQTSLALAAALGRF